MAHPLDGINQKLDRAEKNIINLNGEIESFLDSGDYRVIPDVDDEAFDKALKYHSSRQVPIKFSVLAGEAIYHLRSALDHLVWQLVLANGETPITRNEFPIYEKEPSQKFISEGYGRRIQGVSPNAETIIKRLQPYNAGPRATNELLWIIHDMNIVDKHRELALVLSVVKVSFRHGPIIVQDGEAELLGKMFSQPSRMDVNYQLGPKVCFKEFGMAEMQPVIPSLAKLLGKTLSIRDELASEIK